jgi:hypothetical protein
MCFRSDRNSNSELFCFKPSAYGCEMAASADRKKDGREEFTQALVVVTWSLAREHTNGTV